MHAFIKIKKICFIKKYPPITSCYHGSQPMATKLQSVCKKRSMLTALLVALNNASDYNNKKLSYCRETARQLRIHAQLTRCFSAVAV